MTHKAHDALFKAGFETPEHAAAVFRQILPATIVAAIDWDTIVPQSGSFIDPDLRDRHTDLLFAVRLRDDTGGPPVLLYLLLEHQSTNDDDMPFRMLVYLVRILERYQKTHGGPLPIVIPAVVAHPPEGWTAPTRLHDLFDPPPSSIPGLAALVPDFSLLLEDISHASDEDLQRWELPLFARLTLALLRDVRHADRLRRSLPLWVSWFTELIRGPNGVARFQQAMRYVFLVAGELYADEIHAKLLEIPDAEEVAMTIAEKLRAEGRAEGRMEGRTEGHAEGRTEGHARGLADALSKMMTLKFGPLSPAHAERIASAPEPLLEAWLERILPASSPDDVIADRVS